MGRMTKAEQIARDLKEPELARRFFELRIKGIPVYKIAQACDCSPGYVNQIMQKYIKESIVPLVEEDRRVHNERLEYLWQKLVASGKLEKGDPAAINAGVNILRRQAENKGLDAPSKVELSATIDPKEIELRDLILAARSKARDEIRAIKGSVPSDDDDIMEGEVIDDE